MADAMSNLGTMNIVGQQNIVVVFAGEHQKVFEAGGWTKSDVKQHLFTHASRTVAEIKRAGRMPGPAAASDKNDRRHVVRKPDDILVVSAGARAGAFSAYLPGWGGYTMTRAITTLITSNLE